MFKTSESQTSVASTTDSGGVRLRGVLRPSRFATLLARSAPAEATPTATYGVASSRLSATEAPSDKLLVSLDPEGFHVRAGSALLYVPFSAPCMTSEEVRAEMVRLARASPAAP